MGNYRFRLSDMIPNAWFYKLRDMNKTKTPSTTLNHHKKPPPYSSYYSSPSSTTTQPPHNHHFPQPTNSLNYYTPHHDPPTKPSKRLTPNRKTIYKPSPKHISLTNSPHTSQDNHFFNSPESTQSRLTTCDHHQLSLDQLLHQHDLPPIITKPVKPTSRNRQTTLSGNKVNQTPARKSTSGVKVKLRSVNSPKLALTKRINGQKSAQRKNMNASFAVVKSSFDPQKDFMESMMEMIVENNMRESKELEELLACYLSLNSEEYHGVIVKAFEQIWFSLPDP